MNATERIESLLQRANIAFTIGDLPDTYGEETHNVVRAALEAHNCNVYDYVCKLLLVCGRLEEALTYTLDNKGIDTADMGPFEEPSVRDGSAFYAVPEELTDEVLAMMNS